MSDPAPNDSSGPEPSIESLFVEFLGRRVAGEDPDIHELCEAHPEHAEELRRLHSVWMEAGGSAGEGGGFSPTMRSIRARFGEEVDPGISLDADRPDDSKSMLDRLKEHRSSNPRYSLRGEIARGGMGAILRVWDEDLRRHLAMKVILGQGAPATSGDTPAVAPEILSRFLEEAQVTGQLDHPGIVPVHELGLDAAGRVYFTMKLVKGRTFEQVIEEVHGPGDEWTLTRAVGALLKACEAIAFAHSKEVIHRDLKPANLMVGRFGEVYVMDWGVARVLGREDRRDLRIQDQHSSVQSQVDTDRRQDGDSPLLTMDGQVLGTPAYMSPEQARGELDRMGPASDVYSMGAILYHLLSNQVPYVPTGARVSPYMLLRFVMESDPKPLRELNPNLPVELVAICEKAMSRQIEDRYVNVEDLAADLRAYLEGKPVGARPPKVGYLLRLAVRRHKAVAATLAISVTVLLLAGLGFLLRIDQARRDVTAERDAKQSALLETRALALASTAAAARAEDPMRALLLAESAAKLSPSPEIIRELRACILASRERIVLREHSGFVFHAAYAPAGRHLSTASADGVIQIWAADGTRRCRLPAQPCLPLVPLVFSPDSESLLTVFSKQNACLLTLDGEFLVAFIGHWDLVTSLAISPDGKHVLTGSSDNTARLWDMNGKCVAVLDGHVNGVDEVLFSPDGRTIATTDSHEIRLWDRSGNQIGRFEGGDHPGIQSIAFSPEGSRVAGGAVDGTASIWTIADGSRVVCGSHEDSTIAVEFSPDGTKLLTASIGKTARLYTLDGTLLTEFKGHVGALQAATFSPDGRRILTAGVDKNVRLWDLGGTLEAELIGHSTIVFDARFSPGGTRVVTASADGTARVWSVEAEEVHGVRYHSREATCAVASSDGRIVATGSLDKTVQVSGDGESTLSYRGSFIGAVQELWLLDDGGLVFAEDNCGGVRQIRG